MTGGPPRLGARRTGIRGFCDVAMQQGASDWRTPAAEAPERQTETEKRPVEGVWGSSVTRARTRTMTTDYGGSSNGGGGKMMS